MPATQGAFVWYEMMAADAAAAADFYADAVGWTARAAEGAPMPYILFAAPDGQDAAGCMALPAAAREAGAHPFWLGYVAVDDVDASVAKALQLGGSVYAPADDIPGVGRFAMLGDPQGAAIGIFKFTAPGMGDAAGMAPGHGGWRELYAADAPVVFDFYAQLFGWTKGEAMPMGEMGVYQIILHGGQMLGGMMTKPKEMPRPAWGYYFVVDGIDEAVARVTKHGAQIINGPMEVPGGGWIIQGIDPHGAMFALTGPKSRG